MAVLRVQPGKAPAGVPEHSDVARVEIWLCRLVAGYVFMLHQFRHTLPGCSPSYSETRGCYPRLLSVSPAGLDGSMRRHYLLNRYSSWPEPILTTNRPLRNRYGEDLLDAAGQHCAVNQRFLRVEGARLFRRFGGASQKIE